MDLDQIPGIWGYFVKRMVNWCYQSFHLVQHMSLQVTIWNIFNCLYAWQSLMSVIVVLEIHMSCYHMLLIYTSKYIVLQYQILFINLQLQLL